MSNSIRLGLLCSILVLSYQKASTQSVDQWTHWGDAAVEQGQYYGASRYYAGALALEPGRMVLQWKQAEAARLSNQYTLAAQLYERVHRKDMGRTYPSALRWSAEMQQSDGAYADATRSWNKLLQKEKNDSSLQARRARNALIGCAAADVPPDPMIQLDHIPPPVNTYASEFAARFGPDSVLYFSSLRGELNADDEVIDTAAYTVGIFSTKEKEAGWNEPLKEEGPPDAFGMEPANLMWTSDGQRMFFSQVTSDGTRTIATRTPNGPGEPVKGIELGYAATQPWAATLNGKNILFFSCDHPDGAGGMDIWLGELINDELKNIRNAGPDVNTPGDETCPSFDPSTNTLWFSSNFLPGLGGFDIFRSEFNMERFGHSENAGRPINSPANDLYPIFNSISGEGWLTSNRIGSFSAKGETCCNDLYRFRAEQVASASNLVSDTISIAPDEESARTVAEPYEIFPLKLYFHNDEPDPRSWSTTTEQDYGNTYAQYEALWPTYRSEQDDPARITDFFENEVAYGMNMLRELEMALLAELRDGRSITLEVRGHASPLAKNDYNKNLSQRRIESLRVHFRRTLKGAFTGYLDSTDVSGGILRVLELPFGEDNSAAGVSDDLNDLKRSVFSVEAARERRIEVERVSIAKQEDGISVELGTVHQGVEQTFNVPISNNSDRPLSITESRSECDCTFARPMEGPIPAGASADLEIIFTGRAIPGPLVRRIIVITDGVPEQIILNVHGTVVE